MPSPSPFNNSGRIPIAIGVKRPLLRRAPKGPYQAAGPVLAYRSQSSVLTTRARADNKNTLR